MWSPLAVGTRRALERLGGGGVQRGRVMFYFEVGAWRGRKDAILLIYLNRCN